MSAAAATITTFADVIADALQAPDVFGMPPGAAAELAAQIVRVAAARGHGGTEYHLHCLAHITREERYDRIKREFNGRNVREICRRYGVHRSTVYRIVRRSEPC